MRPRLYRSEAILKNVSFRFVAANPRVAILRSAFGVEDEDERSQRPGILGVKKRGT